MQPYFAERLRKEMLSDKVGRQLLRERPRITSDSLDINYLRNLPGNTVGRQYVEWLDREHVSPDTRLDVRFLDNPECAYVMQRYRECHDFYHSIAKLPVFMEGEIAVKALEFANMGIPMTGLAAFSEPFKLKKRARDRMWSIYIPWGLANGAFSKPLINVYWEKQLERDADELRRELGIALPPDLRTLRKRHRNRINKKPT